MKDTDAHCRIPDNSRFSSWSWAQLFAAGRKGRVGFDFEVAIEVRLTITNYGRMS